MKEKQEETVELQELINEWDPVGLLALGAPSDEYDCLVAPTLSQLANGISPAELAALLGAHIKDHFGVKDHFAVRAARAQQFAELASTWYRSRS